jgi:hypothetical protein
LKYLERCHPSLKIAITNCFEEGVNMYRGNNHNWHLFSDGGPWMPFIPSRKNALAPAEDDDDAIDIIAVPHLNRDMIMAINSRDDLFASHPLNLFRARINQGDQCPYHFRALEEWAAQSSLNGWAYYNVFVSTSWLTPGHWAVPDMDAGTRIYVDTLKALKALETEGRGTLSTMSGFSEDFRASVPVGAPHICHWKDVLRENEKRQVVWVCNSHYRLTLDLNIGGTIVDLRPYAGGLDGDQGPDCANLQNGNHPFLISAEHRGGFWNSGQAAFLEVDGQEYPLWNNNRVRARVERVGAGWVVEADPVVVDFGHEEQAELVSRWHFDGSSGIRMERELIGTSCPNANYALCEWFGGCFGSTEYPENLRGVELMAYADSGQLLESLAFDYASAERKLAGACRVEAEVPQANTIVSLEVDRPDNVDSGSLHDGWLFSPYYGIRLKQKIAMKQRVSTILNIRKLS